MKQIASGIDTTHISPDDMASISNFISSADKSKFEQHEDGSYYYEGDLYADIERN
jgi:hypothetical protein